MLIRVIRVASVKSSIGILTHQGHISKVNANADSVSQSVTPITSRASVDAKYSTDLPEALGRRPPPGGKAKSNEHHAHFHLAPAVWGCYKNTAVIF